LKLIFLFNYKNQLSLQIFLGEKRKFEGKVFIVFHIFCFIFSTFCCFPFSICFCHWKQTEA